MTSWTGEHEQLCILPPSLSSRPLPQVIQNSRSCLVKAPRGVCSFLCVCYSTRCRPPCQLIQNFKRYS
jgi:hypothetical protein